MENFLSKFNGTIQNRQIQQILKKLNKRRSAGEFQNSLEFQEEFEFLLDNLIKENIESSLIVYPALPLRRTDSEKYNDMLLNAYNSLEAAFEELDQIEKVQTNHQNIIKNVKLENINSGIKELKTKLNLYKFLRNDRKGFENSIYSSFNETKEERVNRGKNVGDFLFLDQKTQKVLNPSFDAEVDPIGEALQLSSENKKEIPVKYISQEFGNDFKISKFKLEQDPEEILGNIIDSVNGTYWKQIIRREEPDETVKVKLVLTLAGMREINYLEIDSLYNNRLDKIDYVNSSGSVISILESDEYRDLNSHDRIVFSKVSTEKIYLEFSIKENSLTQSSDISTEDFNLIAEIANGPALTLLESAENNYDHNVSYEYKIGIDNIRVGFQEYRETSIYTSKPLFIKEETGILGLTVKERRPYLDSGIVKLAEVEDAGHVYLSSLEYWIVKEDLDSDVDNEESRVLKTHVFPIIASNKSSIFHERLIFTEISSGVSSTIKNVAALNHFPDLSGSNVISLYRNGVLQDASSFENFSSSSNTSPRNSKKMTYAIKVKDVNRGDFYTVSYACKKGNTFSNEYSVGSSSASLEQVDLIGDLTARVGPEGVVLLDESKDKRVEAYRIYLMSIIRQNTANKSVTAFLDEYRLSVGKRDLNKFEGIT